jgi:hypothetical protein
MAVTLRIEVEMQVVAREFSMQQLDATNFNDAITVLGRQARGFGI